MSRIIQLIAVALAFNLTACSDLDSRRSFCDNFNELADVSLTKCGGEAAPVQVFTVEPLDEEFVLHEREISEVESTIEAALQEEGPDAPSSSTSGQSPPGEVAEGQPEAGPDIPEIAVVVVVVVGDPNSQFQNQNEGVGEDPDVDAFEGNVNGIDEDLNGNGILDPSEDLDGDGRLDLGNEDLDGDGNFDNIIEDLNGNGLLDDDEDMDGDGHLDAGDEDLDGDGHFDNINEDANENGVLDPSEDLDGDGLLDTGNDLPASPTDVENGDGDETDPSDVTTIDENGNGVPDAHENPGSEEEAQFGDDGLPIADHPEFEQPENDVEADGTASPDGTEAGVETEGDQNDDPAHAGEDDQDDDPAHPDDEDGEDGEEEEAPCSSRQ